MKTLEIYFDDLTIPAQQEVLNLYGMESEADRQHYGNFEICPLCILEAEDE